LFNRESFDIYFIHYLNLQHWQSYFLEKGIVDQVLEAKKQGLYRYLGFSSHDTPDNACRILDTGLFDAVILPFNLLQREHRLTMAFAQQKGIGVIVMNPLAGGALVDPAIYEVDSQTAGDQNLAETGLNYVLSQPCVDTVLSGMTSLDMIDENIQTVYNRRLTASEMAQLESSISPEKSKHFIPCTSCNYCMPCVQGIDIPKTIAIWNQYCVLTRQNIFSRDYAALAVTAECCIECSDCVSKCPRGINIPALMNDAAQLFMTRL
jgi:predicted aldo/keto reductase-like oxidoreductase